jgi:hypothetical protein
MNVTAANHVADGVLPLLVTLVQARKQARWQWKHCADEHKHRWTCIIARLDERISMGEKVVDEHMNLLGFHVKRMVVE